MSLRSNLRHGGIRHQDLVDDVAEIVSLGNTLMPWRKEILSHHRTGASNGPTEGFNLCVKKVKRCAYGMRSFEHYLNAQSRYRRP